MKSSVITKSADSFLPNKRPKKLGFVYQRKTEGIEVSLLGEIRTGHSNLMTKERWQKVNGVLI